MGPLTGSHTVSTVAAPSTNNSSYSAAPAASLNVLLQRLISSPTGAAIVRAYAPYGKMPHIVLASDDQLPAADNGTYNRATNTITLRASLLHDKPEQALVTLSHELFHGLDNASGMSNWIDQHYDATTAHLTEESRAYSVASRVQHDMGYAQNTVGPVAQAADGAADITGAYANAWTAIKKRENIA